MYALLKFPKIADVQGYPVAEAFLQFGSSNDDGSAKQLDLALQLAEKEQDRKANRGRADYDSGGSGFGRGGGRGGRGGFAGGKHGYGIGSQCGSWQGSDALGYAPSQGYGPPQMSAAPPLSPGYFMAPAGPGPAQVVKAMGASAQAPAVRGKCFHCQEFGHFQAQCPHLGRGDPPSGSM